MDERSLLSTQLDVLDRKLAWVGHVLHDTEQVDKALYERLSVRFAQLVEDQQRELQSLRTDLRRPAAKLEDGWKRLEVINEDCANLCRESLAFLGGLFLRKYQLDHLTSFVADNLCEYWCKTSDVSSNLLVIPATEDSFTGWTNIIRVRFPDFSIWSLPIVAHEFGHYLQTEKRDQRFPELFTEIVMSEGQEELTIQTDSILQEQFADLFAIYVLGPAYACTCIWQEFNPRTADRDRLRHPSDARRVRFVLQALEKMQEQVATRPYSWTIERLTRGWDAATAATKSRPLTREELQQLDHRLGRLYEVLDDPSRHLKGAHYAPTRWSRVRPLADELKAVAKDATGGDGQQIVDRVMSVLEGQKGADVVPDLLNAAWLCRLRDDGLDPDVISYLALSACRGLLT